MAVFVYRKNFWYFPGIGTKYLLKNEYIGSILLCKNVLIEIE